MRGSVLLALSQAFLVALAASQAGPDARTAKEHSDLKELEALISSTVDVQSRALVVAPGEAFEVTVRVNGNLPKDSQQPRALLGLQFVPILDVDAREQLTGPSELLWKPLERDEASWLLKLSETGNYRADVFAEIPCSVFEPASKSPDLRGCSQRVPLKQKSEFRIRVSQISARLEVSWDQPRTVEALSFIGTTPHGPLQVSALALDSSIVLRDFNGIVQLAAVDLNGKPNYPLPVIGGQTTAPLINGVATFSQLQVLQPGTYKLIATADGAQAAESAPLTITPTASRVIRFCEQPPAVVFIPLLSPIRVAVEVLRPRGGRDTSFAGQVQLQLDKDTAEDDALQNVYKTHCHLGLCLWDNLLLTAPPGKHQLKATAVEDIAGIDDVNGITHPAISAPITFKEAPIAQTPSWGMKDGIPKHIQPDIHASLRFVQAVPSAVRVGQPWDLEVSVEPVPSTLEESVLTRERSLRQRAITAKSSARGLWSSWTQSINLYGTRHREQRLKRFGPQRGRQGLQKSTESGHTIRVSIAKAWPGNLVSLTGQTECTTNEWGRGTFSGLTLWLQEQRATTAPEQPWVKLHVECVTCGIYKGQLRSILETPRIFIDVSSTVGVFKDVVTAAYALVKWRSAKHIMEETHGISAALILPGQPIQMCVQLLDRPFADVLIKARHGQGLTLLGGDSIRISPYVWPMPACWQFAAAPTRQLDVHETEQNVSFQILSADSTFGSRAAIRWTGMATPDGSVRVIVLSSLSLIVPDGLRYMLRNPRSSHIAKLSSQRIGVPKWIEVRSGPLKKRARFLLLPKSATTGKTIQPSVASVQWVNKEVDAFLQWKAVGLVAQLMPPQTKVVLELKVVAPSASSISMTGQCVDTDAGNVVLATIYKSIPMHDFDEQSAAREQEVYQALKWEELEVLLDWGQLSPASAGLLHHHVVCEFRAMANHTQQQLRLLPKASVDIIVVRKQCSTGEVFTFQRNACEPCPEGFGCSLAIVKPCTDGEVSPLGSLTCEVSSPQRESESIGASRQEKTDCPMNMYLSDRTEGLPECTSALTQQKHQKDALLDGNAGEKS
ncbi:hypothetical protein, conserved [Eimeria brunetti]|uniref:Uncharacterized protein n=1 Tax=Eimeria brunetti TaxID=51314 RepID=U6LQF8_9EIME|nr:hypothetical protein, conserved [Eimeria brunetti]